MIKIKASYYLEIKREDNDSFRQRLPKDYMSYVLNFNPETLYLEVVWWGEGYQAPHNVVGIYQFLEKYDVNRTLS